MGNTAEDADLHDGYAFSDTDFQIQVFQDLYVLPTRIFEGDALKFDRSSPLGIDIHPNVWRNNGLSIE